MQGSRRSLSCSMEVLFQHKLSSISFASSGEADMVDFVSYVAKAPPPEDEKAEGAAEMGTNRYSDGGGRRCYVFFCSGGCSRDFISSIGEAFKLGYKGFKQIPETQDFAPQPPPRPVIDDLDPPLPQAPAPPVPVDPWFAPQSKTSDANDQGFKNQFDDSAWLLQDNPPIIPVGSQPTNWVAFSSNSQPPQQQPDQPPPLASNGNSTPSSVGLEQSVRSLEPIGEPWYVGQVTRQKAESLLQYDGDFLVRASTQSPNQFVLSGMQNGKKRHLLLINPEGQVRTKDRIFSSIQELIDFHLRSTTPIRSADNELKLVFPVSPNCLDQ
ncbi:unnamed protein product [Hymenolepis diminuta]|uniref:SH2 domain-containing protein n=1 Tax=Hymenolepis diminuta TaxID=6216 RepID=A0A0R3SHL0_HYMDI|nr:unnamed protein product [Hymenolepis diminuta]